MNIEKLEKEMLALIAQHSSKEPPVLKNINFWRETSAAKHAANCELLAGCCDGSVGSLFDKTFALYSKPINNCNKLCVDFVLSHVKSNIHGVHLSKVRLQSSFD